MSRFTRALRDPVHCSISIKCSSYQFVAIRKICSVHLFHVHVRRIDLLRTLCVQNLHILQLPTCLRRWARRWACHRVAVPLFIESANHVGYANELGGIRLYYCHPSRECVIPAHAATETFYKILNAPQILISYCSLSILLYALVASCEMHIKVHSINAYVDRHPTIRAWGCFFVHMTRESYTHAP